MVNITHSFGFKKVKQNHFLTMYQQIYKLGKNVYSSCEDHLVYEVYSNSIALIRFH